jgi:hypothetical protein
VSRLYIEKVWFLVYGGAVIAGSSNGRTTDSESVYLGSSPSPAASLDLKLKIKVRSAIVVDTDVMKSADASKRRIYAMSFAKIYPLYISKVERKGRKKEELDTVVRWLTGYTQKRLESQIKKQTDLQTFFAEAPKLNPSRALITGVICGVRVEDITDPLMQEIRYMDKLVDELAKGRPMEKILRKPD